MAYLERVKMKLSDIQVSSAMRNTTPRQEKMEAVRQYYQENGKLDSDIRLNEKNYLVDGYIGFLVLEENGVEEVEVVRPGTPIYVFGRHNTCPKEYCWRITGETKDIHNLKIGNKMVVRTSSGNSVAVITRFEALEQPPVQQRIKSVIVCLDE